MRKLHKWVYKPTSTRYNKTIVNLYKDPDMKYLIITPDKSITECTNLAKFAREHNLNLNKIRRTIHNDRFHRGYNFYRLDGRNNSSAYTKIRAIKNCTFIELFDGRLTKYDNVSKYSLDNLLSTGQVYRVIDTTHYFCGRYFFPADAGIEYIKKILKESKKYKYRSKEVITDDTIYSS